jgi:rare lipoprotein A
MRYATKFLTSATAMLLLSSCGSIGGGSDQGGLETASSNNGVEPQQSVADFPSKLGAPYKIGNATYTPEDVAAYDEVGYASYYGQELGGRPTANGEVFLPAAATAAHKTLPMPTYAEVTALETGRTILVRINDRGPFSSDRLIDLSEGAARQLGITRSGVAGVRVRKVNPPEQERAVLRAGATAAERIETPESLLRVLRDKLSKLPRPSGISQVPITAPNPQYLPPADRTSPPATRPQPNGDGRFIREGAGAPSPRQTASRNVQPTVQPSEQPVASGSGYVVQLASFGSRSRAEQLARKLGASVSASADGRVFRVRYGPYANEAEAQSGLATAKKRGYPQARLFRE